MKVVIISNFYEFDGEIKVHPKYFPIIAYSIPFVKYQLKRLNVKPHEIYIIPYNHFLINDTNVLKEISPNSLIINETSTYFKIKRQNYLLFIILLLITLITGTILPNQLQIIFFIQLLIFIFTLLLYFKNLYYKNNYILIKNVI